MKKRFLGLLAVLACFSLASCGNDSKDKDNTPEATGLEVTVLNPDNTPVTGVQVQWCSGNLCMTPVAVNDKGVAVLQEYDKTKDYNVHVLRVPEGYTYNPFELVQNESNKKGSIKLVEQNSYSSGDGSKATPYVLTEGYYSVTLKANALKYFTITPSKAGNITFESYAISPTDPAIAYFGELINNEFASSPIKENDNDDKVGNDYNFKLSVDGVAPGKTYVFAMISKTAGTFTFNVKID